jgi:hypothetical protein
MSWLCNKLADSAGHGNLDEVLEILNMPRKQLQRGHGSAQKRFAVCVPRVVFDLH